MNEASMELFTLRNHPYISRSGVLEDRPARASGKVPACLRSSPPNGYAAGKRDRPAGRDSAP